MENKYRKTKTTVSFINYHFIFYSRCRRKIFYISGLEDRFKELTLSVCSKLDLELLKIECNKDYVYLFINAPTNISPADIMYHLKSYTSKILREEFMEISKLPSLWTRNFFVSTANDIEIEDIKQFIEEQKKDKK